MLDELTAGELEELLTFRELRPSDGRTTNLMIGRLCALIANINGDQKAGEVKAASDFLPDWFFGRHRRPVRKAGGLSVFQRLKRLAISSGNHEHN